jgi:hypothetical protein
VTNGFAKATSRSDSIRTESRPRELEFECLADRAICHDIAAVSSAYCVFECDRFLPPAPVDSGEVADGLGSTLDRGANARELGFGCGRRGDVVGGGGGFVVRDDPAQQCRRVLAASAVRDAWCFC